MESTSPLDKFLSYYFKTQDYLEQNILPLVQQYWLAAAILAVFIVSTMSFILFLITLGLVIVNFIIWRKQLVITRKLTNLKRKMNPKDVSVTH